MAIGVESLVDFRPESGVITEDLDEGDRRSSDDPECLRKQRLQKAMLVSEEWKSAMVKPRTTSSGKYEYVRPSLSVHKFKQESAFALSTELSVASDSKICSVIKNMLFLLREADLIKDNILYKCKKMKEDFEREESVVRGILAEANIPAAISDSLLDSHFTMSSTRIAGSAQEAPHPVVSPNNREPSVDSTMTAVVPPPFPPTNVPPPPVISSVPPPMPPAFPVHASASMPDLSLPPPNITNVTNMSQAAPAPTLPP
ncbi:hypothetical protein COOONC_23046, partial [Cooperia oncophora]